MPLKAKKPEAVEKRLKLMLFGVAGSGKTIAASKFPQAYYIDTERGCENDQYVASLKKQKSVLYQTTDYSDVMEELRCLLTEKHDYRTVVIDPISTIFHEQIEVAERTLSDTAFGRPYSEAGKMIRRMFKRLMQLDMSVIVTCHAKVLYGDDMTKLGHTFDSWNKTDYTFDLVIQLCLDTSVDPPKRWAKVEKSRIDAFRVGECFNWSYEEFVKRYGAKIKDAAEPQEMATGDQVKELEQLAAMQLVTPATLSNWKTRAGVEEWSDMTADQAGKCIKALRAKLPVTTGA